ncbi:MAG TPA: TIGR03936 family radical SAM-associated protein [Gemmataceae bacterium]
MGPPEKVRIRFRKAGDLRWVSHLDLTRCFERMLRRAEIPFRSSGGFHPMPRLVFALSLPLGVVGAEEVVEVELTAPLPPDELLARLAREAPPGLSFLSAKRVPAGAAARPRRIVYRLALPPERAPAVRAACERLLAGAECWVARARPQPRRVNVRPFVRGLRADGGALEMDLWVTPAGTARADELLELLGAADLAEGGTLERATLELWDEISPEQAAEGPALTGQESVRLETPAPEPPGRPGHARPARSGGLPSGPVVE